MKDQDLIVFKEIANTKYVPNSSNTLKSKELKKDFDEFTELITSNITIKNYCNEKEVVLKPYNIRGLVHSPKMKDTSLKGFFWNRYIIKNIQGIENKYIVIFFAFDVLGLGVKIGTYDNSVKRDYISSDATKIIELIKNEVKIRTNDQYTDFINWSDQGYLYTGSLNDESLNEKFAEVLLNILANYIEIIQSIDLGNYTKKDKTTPTKLSKKDNKEVKAKSNTQEIISRIKANKEDLVEIFEKFKGSDVYNNRIEQERLFQPFAQGIIQKALSDYENLTCEHFTAFIQMFSVRCSENNFGNQLRQLFQKEEDINSFIEEFHRLAATGYAAVGAAKISKEKLVKRSREDLRDPEISEHRITEFLKNIDLHTEIEDIKKDVKNFDNLNIPYVTSGIYSPWLVYLKPEICPVINRANNNVLNKIGWSGLYSDAIDICNCFKDIFKEDKMGIIDSFLYNNHSELCHHDDIIDRINGTIVPPPPPPHPLKTNITPNIILYGPPGTGKTYSTIDRAVEIVVPEEYEVTNTTSNEDNLKNHKANVETFRKNLDKQIFFLTFHQNYSYEDFVGGLRPDLTTENDKKLRFKWAPGVFLRACAAAFKENDLEKEITDEDIENFLSACKNKSKELLTEDGYLRTHKVVLIIDEINRANISRVFGELITLIEDDKRIGGEHGLIITLPNGQKFGVPSNLIIIGTMNTADKSIALVDLALRRRFDFEAMYPKPELVIKSFQEKFRKLNENILDKKKTADYQIGHSFFIARDTEEIGVTDERIKNTFDKKVIPLLMEYFMNDIEKVKVVLKEVIEIDIDENSQLKFIAISEIGELRETNLAQPE